MFDQITLACENANTPSLPPVNVLSQTHPLSIICVDPAKNFNLKTKLSIQVESIYWALKAYLIQPLSARYFKFHLYALLYSHPTKLRSCQIVLTSFLVFPVFHKAFLSIVPGPDSEFTTCNKIQ